MSYQDSIKEALEHLADNGKFVWQQRCYGKPLCMNETIEWAGNQDISSWDIEPLNYVELARTGQSWRKVSLENGRIVVKNVDNR